MYACLYRNVRPSHLPVLLMELNFSRFAEAARVADVTVKLDPTLTVAHYCRVLAYYKLGQAANAEDSIRAIIRSGEDKRDPWVHAMLGDIYVRDGDLDSAAAEYHRLLELEPDSFRVGLIRKRLEALELRRARSEPARRPLTPEN